MKEFLDWILAWYIFLNFIAFNCGALDGFFNKPKVNSCLIKNRTHLYKIIFPAQKLGCTVGNWLGKTN